MAISTNGTVLARLAGALYNTQMSNATYSEVKTLDPAALANALYARDFSSSTDLAVATTLVTNLGLTSVTGLANWVAAQLTAAGTANKGAKVVDLLNGFAQMTADTTYGAYASAFNALVDASLVLSQTTGNAGGTFTAAGTPVAVSGATFSLTTSTDILTTTSITAANKTTAGDDVIYATADGALGTSDVIDGGAGNDTIYSAQTAATQTIAPTLTSVETVTVTQTPIDGKSLTISAANSSGITTLNIKDAGAVSMSSSDELITVSGLAKTTTLGIIGGTASSGTTASEITATFTSAAAADTQKVAISSAGKTAVLTLSTAETVEITATGSSNAIGSLAATAVKTLNIKGTGALTIAASDLAAAVTVDASTTTGTIAFTGETAATSTTFKGGAGNTTVTTSTTGVVSITTGAGKDTVNVSGGNSTGTISLGDGNDTVSVGATSNLTVDDVISGGAGTDAVIVSDATINATVKANLAKALTGFEIVDTSSATLATIDFNALADYDTVRVSAAQAAAYNGTQSKAGAKSIAATMENGDTLIVAAARNGVSGGKSATDAGATGTAVAGGDAIVLTPFIDNGSNSATVKFIGNADITGGVGELSAGVAGDVGGAGGKGLDASNIETLNIVVAGTQAATGTADTVTIVGGAGGAAGSKGTAGATGASVTIGTNGTIVLTSELDANTSTAALQNNIDLGTVIGTNANVNGSAFLGNITVTAASGNVTISGGAGADTLTGGAGVDTISGGAGKDVITGGAGGDVLSGGSGRDVFVIGTAGHSGVGTLTGAVSFDKIADFGKAASSATATEVTAMSSSSNFQSSTLGKGGADADLLKLAVTATLGGVQSATDVKAAVTGAVSITATETAKGVLSLGGTEAASVDTLTEWVAVAAIMAATAGDVVAFEFSGNTYVYQAHASAPDLIQLTGVTGSTGITLIGGSVASAVGDIFVI